MGFSIFYVFPLIAVRIVTDVHIVLCLAGGKLFNMALEFFDQISVSFDRSLAPGLLLGASCSTLESALAPRSLGPLGRTGTWETSVHALGVLMPIASSRFLRLFMGAAGKVSRRKPIGIWHRYFRCEFGITGLVLNTFVFHAYLHFLGPRIRNPPPSPLCLSWVTLVNSSGRTHQKHILGPFMFRAVNLQYLCCNVHSTGWKTQNHIFFIMLTKLLHSLLAWIVAVE